MLLTCLGASLLGVFSSAAMARLLSLPAALGLASLTRCITTPLAMASAASFLQPADVSVAVLLVVITGLVGAPTTHQPHTKQKGDEEEEEEADCSLAGAACGGRVRCEPRRAGAVVPGADQPARPHLPRPDHGRLGSRARHRIAQR